MIALLSDILLKALFTPETPINEDHKPKYIHLLGYAASVYEVFEEVNLSYSLSYSWNYFNRFSLHSKNDRTRNKNSTILELNWWVPWPPRYRRPCGTHAKKITKLFMYTSSQGVRVSVHNDELKSTIQAIERSQVICSSEVGSAQLTHDIGVLYQCIR